MSLQTVVNHKILNDVLKSVNKPGKWKVLVLDHLSTRMISTCCKMQDIMDEGITIVEDLFKGREPLKLEAVYLVTPEEKTIEALTEDFKDSYQPMYKAAHIFFTTACPDDLFKKLCNAKIKRFIKTLQEINIAYLPYESQVFTLDRLETFSSFYNPDPSPERTKHIEQMADQIATLCSCLGEFPAIRFRQKYDRLSELAHVLQSKLDEYKKNDPTMGEGPQKDRSQIILLDRAFDPVSPFVHELTLQAMAYDLLPINNDVYKFDTKKPGGMAGGAEKEALLDESDFMWKKLRHRHIAEVLNSVSEDIKKFSTEKRMTKGSEKTSMRDLQEMVKKMPQYQKELSKYITALHLAEDCMQLYNKTAEKLCPIEQNLALGEDSHGEKVKDPMPSITPVLLDKDVGVYDKVRIIILYIWFRGGETIENLRKLLDHAQIPEEDRCIIRNIAHMGIPVISDHGEKIVKPPRKERGEAGYTVSRWVPYIKDIMENAIEDKLDIKMFPFLTDRSSPLVPKGTGAIRSARYGNWHKDRGQSESTRIGPRLIIFIVGGMSYSEMRCAYEVTASNKAWEVIIGSSHILTPENLLKSLKNLSD